MSTIQPIRLMDEFRQRRRDLFRTAGPGLVATLLAFVAAFYFVEPPPPDTLVIATGKADGRYFAVAAAYAEVFNRNGVTLELRETAGSLENFERLLSDDVTLAIAQGGTEPEEAFTADRFQGIASLYFEPLWVFYRSDLSIKDLGDITGRRIAVGESGSGTYSLATQLLTMNGIADGEQESELVDLGAEEASAALQDGQIDVAMFVVGPESPVVEELLRDPEITLMDFSRQRAYERRFPFLKGVTLEEGVVNFEEDLPPAAVRLIAPAANLVATKDLHEAFVPLLLEAALQQHNDGGFFANDIELPSQEYVSFSSNAAARDYLKHGPSFFQRHLSFWLASLIDRTKILIIPLITLLIPLFKIAPPLYRWRIRSRIYRWYGVLRRIDQELRAGNTANVAEHAATMQAMSTELDSVEVPLSYMEEFYNLRLHINLVRQELDPASGAPRAGDADSA